MHLKKLFLTAVGTLTFFTGQPLSSLETTGFLNLVNGYRQDTTTCLIKSYDPPGTQLDRDLLDATDMDIYLLGFKTQIVLCNLILRLDADYGWGGNGKYREFSDPAVGPSSAVHAHIHKVRVKDFNIGFGYLQAFGKCFGIGPVGGWAYANQIFRLKTPTIDGQPFFLLQDLSYKNTWDGPWLGFDAIYDVCQLNFHMGYEYHWAAWKAKWHLNGPDIAGEAFSDRRKSNDVDGHVAFLDTRWSPCDPLNLGIGLKFQHYTAVDGRERPTAYDLEAIGFGLTRVDKVKQAIWHSFSITFDIGYEF